MKHSNKTLHLRHIQNCSGQVDSTGRVAYICPHCQKNFRMGHTLKKHLQEREKPDTRSYRLCRKKEAKLKKKQQENSVIASAQGHPKMDYALQVAAENIL